MGELMEVTSPDTSLESISYHSLDENEDAGTDGNRSIWQRLAPAHKERLYYIILSKPTVAIPDIVQNWMDRYELDGDRAVIELLQLFVDLSSYQYVNVEAFLEFNEKFDIVPHLEGSDNGVLLETGKYFLGLRNMKKKHEKIADFITVLLAKCASYNILTDFVMLKQTVGLIKDMADSPNVAIRHTGVFLAVKFQTGLIDVISQIIVRLKKIEKKIEERGDSHRLQEKLAKYKTKYEHVNKVLDVLFLKIYNKNWNLEHSLGYYIRQDCISEIIKWVDLLPDRFLQKHYMNHITTSLTDRHNIVRFEALELMSNILNTYHKQLQKDLIKYLIPIKERLCDPVTKIQVRAIEALTSLSQLVDLPKQIQEQLISLMCSSKYKVAAAAGEYYVQKVNLNSIDVEDETEIVYKLIKYEMKQNKKGVTCSLPFVIEAIYEACPRIARLSLYTDFLKIWETDDAALAILLKIITQVMLVGMSGYCSYKRKVDRVVTVTDQDKENITEAFKLALPALLDFYDLEQLHGILFIVNNYKVAVNI